MALVVVKQGESDIPGLTDTVLPKRLGPKRWRRLVAALAMIVGWEALIVQRDVCGLTPSEGEELSVWAARALLRETLREVESAQRR